MGFTKPIEQFLFSNLLTKIHVFMYLKDIIRGVEAYEHLRDYYNHHLSHKTRI